MTTCEVVTFILPWVFSTCLLIDLDANGSLIHILVTLHAAAYSAPWYIEQQDGKYLFFHNAVCFHSSVNDK